MRISPVRRYCCLIVPVLIVSLTVACSSQKGAARGGAPEPVVGIVDFMAENMNLTQARAVTDRVLYYLGRVEGLKVIYRDQMETIFREKSFRISGPCNTDDCITQVGKILGATMMVAGEVSKAGDFYHLEVRLINVSTSRMVNHAFSDVRGIEDLMSTGAESVVNALMSGK